MTKKTNNNALNIKVACCQIMNDYSKESVNSCLKNMQEKSEFKTAKKDTRRKKQMTLSNVSTLSHGGQHVKYM